MTDERAPSDGLGPPPTPDDANRENAIAGALARFDELVVDGRLTTEGTGTDDLAGRRARRQRRAPAAKRWLSAAAAVAVIGLGGVVAVGLFNGADDDQTSQASGQAEPQAGAGQDEATDRVAPADEAVPEGTTPAGAVAEPSQALPALVCDLLEYFGIEMC